MRLRSLLALLALLLPSVACDQATKALAVAHLKDVGANDLAGSFLGLTARLVYAENPGAFLGLGRSLPDGLRWVIFTVAVALVLGGITFVLLRQKVAPLAFFGVSMLVAGGVGNLVDRVARPGGRVVDFAQLGVKTPWAHVQTGVFNVADVQIMGGAALVMLASFRTKRDDEDTGAAAPPPQATTA